jgi:hypothetical protein
MTPQRIILGAWLGIIGLATVRSIATTKAMPQPSVFIGSGVLFTGLYGASSFLGMLPAVIAIGVDVGAVLSPYLKGSTVGPLNQLAGLLDGISGAQTTSTGSSTAGGSFASTTQPPGTMAA